MMSTEEHVVKVVVVGAGIVGLATAFALRRVRPHAEITILEKEAEPALHQTGRNSGVIHSGLYYNPGSAKAMNCRVGRDLLLEFCENHDVDYELCGKIVVATDDSQLDALSALFKRGKENGVDCSPLTDEQLRRREPHVRAVKALLVKDTGIVDYRAVCRKLIQLSEVNLVTEARVLKVVNSRGQLTVCSTRGEYECDLLFNCAGLQSDRVCRLTGSDPSLRIVPFKGEYFRLRPSAEKLCRALIYPVPDPRFPFLGVHLTRRIGGGVDAGPNAVLALGREAYGRSDVNLADIFDIVSYRGFWRLSSRYWRQGVEEASRSLSKSLFIKALQKICPDIRDEDLVPGGVGIRAQAVRPCGKLEDDFQIAVDGPVVNVLNAPSPAATAALAIGREVVSRSGLSL